MLLGTVFAGWLMCPQALAASVVARGTENAGLSRREGLIAGFYARHILPLAPGYLPGITGSSTVLEFDPRQI